jgi:hypothetical protein
MKRIPQPVCPWCRREFSSKRPVPAALICQECHFLLRGLPAETLVQMIVYFAGYSQIALQLLLESNDIVKMFTATALSRQTGSKPPGRKPQAAIAIAPAPSGKRFIA